MMGTLAQTMIEAGERTAPVSYMYIGMLRGMLEESFRLEEPRFFELQIVFFKHMIEKDELFQKTSKKFQAEFAQVLDFPIEQMYYWIFGSEYVPTPNTESVSTNESTNVATENKPHLTLVK